MSGRNQQVLLPWHQPAAQDENQLDGPEESVENKRQITLKAKPGCFVWESTATSVATVEHKYKNDNERESGCASSAVVTAVWSQRKRAKAIIKATTKDVTTGVLVDMI